MGPAELKSNRHSLIDTVSDEAMLHAIYSLLPTLRCICNAALEATYVSSNSLLPVQHLQSCARKPNQSYAAFAMLR